MTGKLFNYYYSLHDEHVKKYGTSVAVFMQVGKFFEMYAPADYSSSSNIQEISSLLNCNLTWKESERMSGFPLVSLEKNVKRLTDHDFTVIIVEQVEANPDDDASISELTAPGVPRKITRIVSKCTNLENTRLRNNIMSIFYKRYTKNVFSFGICVIDNNISNEIVYHDIDGGTSSDKGFAFDSARRFVAQYDPVECIITTQNGDNAHDIVRHLGLTCPIFDRDVQTVDMNVIQDDVYISDNAKLSVCALLTYLREHKIAQSYSYTPFKTDNYLELCSTAIKQLDLPMLLAKGNDINMTMTAMGNRLFTERVLVPVKDIDEMNRRYDFIDSLDDTKVKSIRNVLRDIPDLDKIYTRMGLGKLTPGQFKNVHESFTKISTLLAGMGTLHQPIKHNLQTLIAFYKTQIRVDKQLQHEEPGEPGEDRNGVGNGDGDGNGDGVGNGNGNGEDDDDVDEINKGKGGNYTENIFVEGVIPELDNIFVKLQEATLYINQFVEKALKHLPAAKCKGFKIKDKMGFITTALRADLLKGKMKGLKVAKLQKTVIIYTDELRDSLCLATDIKEQIDSLTSKYFAKFQRDLYNNFQEIMHETSSSVAELDFVQCGYSMAKKYKLVRPIPIRGAGILEIKNVRHLLIEQINQDRKYVPNDCLLGKDAGTYGIILYGVNSCGKTSYLKSIGITLVMAQAGLFVPASSMRFTPVSKVMTRIAGGDNMERSQSSYIVELEELLSMIRHSDENTVILGDEMCRGTEVESANAMVFTTLKWLLEKKSFVIAATHLHSIADNISTLPSAAIYHMKVTFDEHGNVIYDRKLAPGTGPSKYGLEIARAMNFPESFMLQANAFRSREKGENSQLETQPTTVVALQISTRKSRYNAKKILVKCECCGYIPRDAFSLPLDTHHIEFQCNADPEGFHGTSHKNALHNLVALCKECHCKVHKNEIEIIITQGLKTNTKKFKHITKSIEHACS